MLRFTILCNPTDSKMHFFFFLQLSRLVCTGLLNRPKVNCYTPTRRLLKLVLYYTDEDFITDRLFHTNLPTCEKTYCRAAEVNLTGSQPTFSEAVAIRVPCRLSAMQHKAPSWAGMSTGGFSVLAKSTICTWPEWVPGKASRELLLLGHRTQRPAGGSGKRASQSAFTLIHTQAGEIMASQQKGSCSAMPTQTGDESPFTELDIKNYLLRWFCDEYKNT